MISTFHTPKAVQQALRLFETCDTEVLAQGATFEFMRFTAWGFEKYGKILATEIHALRKEVEQLKHARNVAAKDARKPLLAELARLTGADANGWTLVEYGLPPAYESVLIHMSNRAGEVFLGRFDGQGGWHSIMTGCSFAAQMVSHWRPFPAPPAGYAREVQP